MSTFHDGDVYSVDVSRNPLPVTQVTPGGVGASFRNIEMIRGMLGDEEIMASNFCIFISQYDPTSLQYMLDFFRGVAQSIPSRSPSPSGDNESSQDVLPGSAREMLQDRAGIIVLREDLDYYVIPPKADIEQPEMVEVKRAAGRVLLKQDGIFSGLRKSEETGSTEQHLIEMLTAGYVPRCLLRWVTVLT